MCLGRQTVKKHSFLKKCISFVLPAFSFRKDERAVSPVFGAALLLGVLILLFGILAAYWAPSVVRDREADDRIRFQADIAELSGGLSRLPETAGASDPVVLYRGSVFYSSPDAVFQNIFPSLRSSLRPAVGFSAEEGICPAVISVYGFVSAETSENKMRSESDKNNKNNENDKNNKNNENDAVIPEMRWYNKTIGSGLLTFYFDHIGYPDGAYRIDCLSAVFLTQKDGTVLLSPPLFSSFSGAAAENGRPVIVLSAVDFLPSTAVAGDVSLRLTAFPVTESRFTAEKLVVDAPFGKIVSESADAAKAG